MSRTGGRCVGTLVALVVGPLLTVGALYVGGQMVRMFRSGRPSGRPSDVVFGILVLAGSMTLGAYAGTGLGDRVSRALCGYPPRERERQSAGAHVGAYLVATLVGAVLLLVAGISSYPWIRGWRVAVLFASPTVALLVARRLLRSPSDPPAPVTGIDDSRTKYTDWNGRVR